jgi:hypothetical protein
MAHPHLRQRGTVRRVRDESIGELDIPGLPAKFSRWADRSEIAADRLGEHAKTTTRNRNIESNSVTLSDSPHKERGGKRAAGSARRVPRQVVGERRAEVTAGTEPQPSMKMAVENWRAA